MSKLGIASAATGITGTGAAGVYGAYSLGAFGGGEGEKKGWAATEDTPKTEKTEYANKCLKDTFGEWTPTPNKLTTALSLTVTPWDANTDLNACLVYGWEKKNADKADDKKWEGSIFHLTGTMSKGEVGVAVDLTAKVKSTSQIVFSGFSYLLKKEEEKGTATHKLDLKGNKEIILDSGEWSAKFPKLNQGADFTKKGVNSAYWYFLDNGGTKVSPDQDSSHRNSWWKWKNTGIYSLKNGSSNFNIWWEHFFGKDRLNLMALMEKHTKSGGWDGS